MSVVDFEEALAIVKTQAAGLGAVAGVETVWLLAARGQVLAEGVRADRDQPPFDRATRDGFAVRVEEFSEGTAVRVVGSVRAGEVWRGEALGWAKRSRL